ncbi:hypothetical protein TrCOL_g9195 [Triparma columacea]|uniref:Sugar phosphate transporter domain-containing protein n=1 Tax=Triparma columacea TaxID=722753 RepID=A0A9W7L695_9STRA|nr:hypothetical protein TrCOL_g9195 [Triparma columacea]
MTVLSLPVQKTLVGCTWFVVSTFLTTVSTTTFLKYPRDPLPSSLSTKLPNSPVAHLVNGTPAALLLTLWRFGFSQVASLLTFVFLDPFSSPSSPSNTVLLSILKSPISLSLRLLYTLPHFLPAALSLFLANLFNSYALSTSGISLTYVTKCSIPIFTLLLSPLLIPNTPFKVSTASALSLLPICLGIALTSYDSTNFRGDGFAFAIMSCVAQVCLNVFSKKAMMGLNVGGMEAFMNLTLAGFLLTTLKILFPPLLFKTSSILLPSPPPLPKSYGSHPPLKLSIFAAASYHVEYLLSFVLISLISPLTYAVSDAVRRLAVILVGKTCFPKSEDRFTRQNTAGMIMALIGAACYSLLK